MDKAIARHVATASFRSWGELSSLLPWSKQLLEPAEQKALARAVALACAKVMSDVQDKMYALYPELEREYEESMRKYERVL
jgi:hypothetical protein